MTQYIEVSPHYKLQIQFYHLKIFSYYQYMNFYTANRMGDRLIPEWKLVIYLISNPSGAQNSL